MTGVLRADRRAGSSSATRRSTSTTIRCRWRTTCRSRPSIRTSRSARSSRCGGTSSSAARSPTASASSTSSARRRSRPRSSTKSIGFRGVGIGVDATVKQLSGGERQGIAIGRAMHFNADLIVLDEPTAALAVKEVRKVLDFVRRSRPRAAPASISSTTSPMCTRSPTGWWSSTAARSWPTSRPGTCRCPSSPNILIDLQKKH